MNRAKTLRETIDASELGSVPAACALKWQQICLRLPDTVDEVLDEVVDEVANILVKSGPRANILSLPSAVPKFEGRVPVKLFSKNTLPTLGFTKEWWRGITDIEMSSPRLSHVNPVQVQ